MCIFLKHIFLCPQNQSWQLLLGESHLQLGCTSQSLRHAPRAGEGEDQDLEDPASCWIQCEPLTISVSCLHWLVLSRVYTGWSRLNSCFPAVLAFLWVMWNLASLETLSLIEVAAPLGYVTKPCATPERWRGGMQQGEGYVRLRTPTGRLSVSPKS